MGGAIELDGANKKSGCKNFLLSGNRDKGKYHVPVDEEPFEVTGPSPTR